MRDSFRLFGALAVLIVVSAPAIAQERIVPRITVTGEAKVTAPPDVAQFTTGVTTQGRTAREASDANSKAVAAVLAAIKGADIPDKDIQTTRLSVRPVYDPNRKSGPPKVIGFEASNSVAVTVRDIAKLSDVIDRAITGGATDIGGIDFLISSPAPLFDKARTEAIADARRKAEIYAKAAGVTLGRVLSVSEDHAMASPSPVFARSSLAAAPQIMNGEQTLGLSVTVNFEIAQ